jgi:UDP-N-acetyl-D-glucosamine dehydrogenase
VVDKVSGALNTQRKPLNGSHIHIMGVAYKRDIDDMRESPAIDVAYLLMKAGSKVTYSDPYVPVFGVHAPGEHKAEFELNASDAVTEAAKADCVLITTDHSGAPYQEVVAKAKLIVDTRNTLRGVKSDKIVRL